MYSIDNNLPWISMNMHGVEQYVQIKSYVP
jgi:hypothetical protein